MGKLNLLCKIMNLETITADSISFLESIATPVKRREEIISKGSFCLRMNFNNFTDNRISVAVKKRCFAEYSELRKNPRNGILRAFDKIEKLLWNSPLVKKFWTPVKIRFKEKVEEIYINNESAKKRLNSLGYIEDEIATIVRLGNLTSSIEIEQSLSNLSKEKKIDLLQLYMTKIDYAKGFEIDEEIALSITKTLINMGLNIQEINNLINIYIEKRNEWKNTHSPLKISHKDPLFSKFLPRALHIYPHQKDPIYLLFNRKKRGDKIIGKGSYSNVTKAINLFTGCIIARSKTTLNQNMNPILQIVLLNKLEHPSIISLCVRNQKIENSIIRTDNFIEFLTPYLNGGDLSFAEKKYFLQSLTEEDIALCIYSIASALDYLHKKEIIHRDINGRNICVEKNEKGGIKRAFLIDFGLTVSTKDKENIKKLSGTLEFLAPEYLSLIFEKSRDYSEINAVTNSKLDAWAFGRFLFNLCKNKHKELKTINFPFSKNIKMELGNFNKEWFPKPKKESLIPYAIWQLTRFDPKERWSPSQVFKFLGPEFEKNPKIREKLLDAGIKLQWSQENIELDL